jgi:hypothetical protein
MATGQPDTIRNIKRGGSQSPRVDTVKKLAKVAGYSADWLMGNSDLPVERSFEAQVFPHSQSAQGELALIGYIGAGDKVYHFGLGETRLAVPAPPGIDRGVAAEVRGDSMIPVYRDRDLVFAGEHLGQADELIGRDCFVQVQNGPLYLKILRKGSKGRYSLESYNSEASIPNQLIEWIAPVLWIKRHS